jgi:acetylglutamate kinase
MMKNMKREVIFMQTVSDLIILKVGGSILVDSKVQLQLMQDILQLLELKQRIVIVHGGGPFIEKRFNALNKETSKLDGYRITSKSDLSIIEQALFVDVHLMLVDLFKTHNIPCVSFKSPIDVPVTAKQIFRKIEHDLGFVGTVEKVQSSLFTKCIKEGQIPIIPSMACSDDGQTYNINADNMAASIAKHLNAKLLIYATDTDGVYKDMTCSESRIKKMSQNEANQLIDTGEIHGGMIPKIESCIAALSIFTNRVSIISGQKKGAIISAYQFNLSMGTHLYFEGEV